MSDRVETSGVPAGMESTNPAVVLRARGIERQLGGRAILCGVDLALGEGRVLGLVGPNGAGKTTLLRILVGALQPDAGEVLIDERVVAQRWGLARRARMGLGYLPQGPSVFRRLTVWENVRAVPGADQDGCDRALEDAGLSALAGTMAGRLSGGERRRLELARLLLAHPRVLLCDEPFAGLDPRGVESFSQMLGNAALAGRSVLITDHRVEVLARSCDELAVLLDGRIARRASVAEIRGDEDLRTRYFGSALDAGPGG